MLGRKVLWISIAVLSILAFIIGCTPSLVSPVEETEQPTGQIVIKIAFPTEQTRVIPPETTYFEVALQREGSTSWTTQNFYVEEGTEQTATFTVTPGTYRIDACAKAYSGVGYEEPNQFLTLGTTSVTVNAGETKQATIILCPIYYDFTETATQATSTESVVLRFIMKVPTPFVKDFRGVSIYDWLAGELADALSDEVFFTDSVVGTETIDIPVAGSVEYSLIQYTSDEFPAPSVTATTTYTWYYDLFALGAGKWRIHRHLSPVQTFTVYPGSGIIVVIQ